jgi:hypothetical protein
MSNQEGAVLPVLAPEIVEAARQAGGGWLDEVVGNHTPPVPLSAIKGAWRLNAEGELTGEYVANPNYGQMRRGGCPFARGR